MVVGDDHACCTPLDRLTEKFARVDDGVVHESDGDDFRRTEQPTLRVEVEREEMLLRVVDSCGANEFENAFPAIRHCVDGLCVVLGGQLHPTPRQLEGRGKLHGARLADAVNRMRKGRGVLRLRHDDFQIGIEAGKVLWIAGNQTAVLDGKRSNQNVCNRALDGKAVSFGRNVPVPCKVSAIKGVIACDKSALKYNYISFKKGDIADYNICSWPAGRFNLYGFCHKVEHGTAAYSWLGEPFGKCIECNKDIVDYATK